jgi:hypothetical protein
MKPIHGLVVLALVASLAYVLGARSNDNAGTAAERAASGSSVISASAAPGRTGTIDERAFWTLVSDTRSAADGDTGRQSQALEERLGRLPAGEIAGYQRIRRRLDEQAYTWELWGAASVIEDGCSDDCFRDFRSYLISLGRRPYEAALRDPDSLAEIVQDAETGDWENADNVAADAYESATGEDLPVDDSDLSGDPRGERWDDDESALIERFPRLAERFRR